MSFNVQCMVFISLFVTVCSRYLSDYSTDHPNSVEDIQHAICKIDTKDIKASANATITRQLKGVCTSKEMNLRLDQLEKRLFHEISLIKDALHVENVPIPEDDFQTKALENAEYSHNPHNYDYFNTIESVKTEETYNPQTITYHFLQPRTPQNGSSNNVTAVQENTTEKLVTITAASPTTKSFQTSYKRDLEAAKNNISIQNTELGKSFLYFWKIYDIKEILTYSDTHMESPVFYLLGHPLHIKFYPHHRGTQYVAVELSNTNNFVFKHRFSFLNQNNEQGDLTSQILGNSAGLFRISNQKLSKGDFTADGSLIIKVVIALRIK